MRTDAAPSTRASPGTTVSRSAGPSASPSAVDTVSDRRNVQIWLSSPCDPTGLPSPSSASTCQTYSFPSSSGSASGG